MRPTTLAASIAVVLTAWSCGGSSSSPSYPPAPTATPTPTPATGDVVSISIRGVHGAQSFDPNPGTVGSGKKVSWTNTDGVMHHIVSNDGTLDTGDIAPGQSSPAMSLLGDGARYHCTIHPTMVGAINASSGNPPPCSGDYC
jgi:plastocyanin